MLPEDNKNWTREFTYSKNTFRILNKLFVIFLCTMTITGFFPILVLTKFNYIHALIITGIASLLFAVILFSLTIIDFLVIGRIKLFITESMVTRLKNKKKEMLLLDEISEVRVRELSSGSPCCIYLRVPNKKSLEIYGFEGMENILALIIKGISSKVIITKSRQKFNWNHPLVPIIVGFVCALCLFLYAVLKNIIL